MDQKDQNMSDHRQTRSSLQDGPSDGVYDVLCLPPPYGHVFGRVQMVSRSEDGEVLESVNMITVDGTELAFDRDELEELQAPDIDLVHAEKICLLS